MFNEKKLLIGIGKFLVALAILLVGVVLFVPGKFSYSGPENPVQIRRAFMCNGPDANGLPTEEKYYFYSNEIDDIFICVYVVPDKRGSLYAHWIFDPRGTSFYRSEAHAFTSEGYQYFSLSEAKRNEGYVNYFENEIMAGKLPQGKYSVLLKQARNELYIISFEIK